MNFFQFYLENRTQQVRDNDKISNQLSVTSGVLQGRILGPLLFAIYSFNKTKRLKYCQCQLYPDTQFLYSFHPSLVVTAIANVDNHLEIFVT